MRKILTVLSMAAIPAFAVRAADLLLFIDRRTGYMEEWSPLFRLIPALAVLAAGVFAGVLERRWLRGNRADFESTNSSMERASVPAGISFFLAGAATAAASVTIFFGMAASGEIAYVFSPASAGADVVLLYHYLQFISAALGILAGFWFMLVGVWHFRGEGHFAGGRFISVFIAVWYYIRVIKDFIKNPINPNNTTALALIFGLLLLALFYTKYTKAVSVDFPQNEEPSLFSFGVMAFLWVTGFGLPTALVLAERGDYASVIVLAADAFAAAAALGALFARLPAKEKRAA